MISIYTTTWSDLPGYRAAETDMNPGVGEEEINYRSVPVRIARETCEQVNYFNERLNNREIQGLGTSEVSGIKVIEPYDIETVENKYICRRL